MPSNYDAEKRKLIHQKSQQLTTGYGAPNNDAGKDGDIAFRQVEGSGTVQYLKSNEEWVAVSSSGTLPSQRIMVGGGASSTTDQSSTIPLSFDHGMTTGRADDDHTQYVHINTPRTITAPHAFTGSPVFSAINIDGGTINGTTIATDNTQTEWDAAYDHISEDGNSHTFIDQSVVSGGAPAFVATNFSDGGGNAIVTTTQETNWDNHLTVNDQAHSDYLKNNADDSTSGTLTAVGYKDSALTITLGSITDAINGTFSGTLQAEQLTSIDDALIGDDLTVTGLATIGETLTVGDYANIDETMRLSTGSIVDDSGAITFVDENLSTSGTLASGTQTVTGNVTASGIITAEHLTSTDDATITDTLSVDGTMTLSTGRIIDSTGTINFGDEDLTTDGDVDIDGDLDVDGVTNLDVVDVDGAVDMASTLTVAGVVDITNTTDSSDDSGDTGALRVEGGVSIAKKLYVGVDLDVDGVSNLDVTDIDGNLDVDNTNTTIDTTGNSHFKSDSELTLEGLTNVFINTNGTTSISKGMTNIARFDTGGLIYFRGAVVDEIEEEYAINTKVDTYASTWYKQDLHQNYCMVMYSAASSNYEEYPTAE